METTTMNQIADRAGQLMQGGYHCSESVLKAIGDHFYGNVEPTALRMCTPFAGGIGCTHNDLCGALTGAIMTIGMLHGRTEVNSDDGYCQQCAVELRDRFLREFGWLSCQDIKDHWVGKTGGNSCVDVVQRTTQILLEILAAAKRE